MRVELDIFSGRPNPSWELSADEVAELTRRVATLSPCDEAPVEVGLGFRGFVISTASEDAESPAQMRVHRGVVIIQEKGATNLYRDVGKIEQWLHEQAEKRGYGALLS